MFQKEFDFKIKQKMILCTLKSKLMLEKRLFQGQIANLDNEFSSLLYKIPLSVLYFREYLAYISNQNN